MLPVGNGQFLVHTSYGEGKQNNGILHVDLQRKEENNGNSQGKDIGIHPSYPWHQHGETPMGSTCGEWDLDPALAELREGSVLPFIILVLASHALNH